jgi:multidrug efflux pump
MLNFNLSDWAIKHRTITVYIMLVLSIAGLISWTRLGQSEDPPFTFKVMLVRTIWPGATAKEMEQQVTDRIERKLQEVPYVDFTVSYSKPGESVILFNIKDSAPSSEVQNVWYQVRKRVGDIRGTLPSGIIGPFFNDEFGDTFGNIYSLSGDGYSYEQLRVEAERIRNKLLQLPDVSKVDLIGVQEERIYVEVANAKVASLGIDPNLIIATLQNQNAMTPAGAFELQDERIYLRVSGEYDSVESIQNLIIRPQGPSGKAFRLGDIARVFRGYVDPPSPKMRFMGQRAIGIGIAMRIGGDIVKLGHSLDARTHKLQGELPLGLELKEVTAMHKTVTRSINEFTRSLLEAVLIVLAVNFFSLGARSGMVVALSIPLVLAGTFLFMSLFDVGLHKISLGALILALGLLVDDAIIAIEMMALKMEQGWDRARAASFAYTSTAFPMLSGTLVTAAGFLPIALAKSGTGEYTRSIFQVTVIALLISWIAAVVFIPYLGYKLLPDYVNGKPVISPRMRRIIDFVSRFSPRLAKRLEGDAAAIGEVQHHDEHEIYDRGFYKRFRGVVTWCVDHKWITIGVTVLMFAASVFGFKFVQQQFFPSSGRPELLVDFRLVEGSSFAATEKQILQFEQWAAKQPEVETYTSFVGSGAPRFYLPLDQQLPTTKFGQVILLTKGVKEREVMRDRLIKLFESDYPEIRYAITRLENGPPSGYPLQFRVSGDDPVLLRQYANEMLAVLAANPQAIGPHLDWDEQSKVIRIELDETKIRALGMSPAEISGFINSSVSGSNVTQFREGNQLIEIVARGDALERQKMSLLKDLQIPTKVGKTVPLTQIAKLSPGYEDGLIWRRNRLPTITVRASMYSNVQASVIMNELQPQMDKIAKTLPDGYSIQVGGPVENSAKGGASIAAGMPVFFFVVLTVLVLQLQNFSRVTMVLLTAPLGLIGVTIALLALNKPFGFVAMLGTIALMGMIMRNSVILVDQVEQDVKSGHTLYIALIESAVRRFRPIMLTALAAILAMIPLVRSDFFGPMAVAIMGGLFVATVLTLLFLPALYAAWYKVTKTNQVTEH